ncbi:MAG TPA: MoxR family ATPase [Acidobacteriota bacterium]|nr:MoxR family ATPase [Acidobacteriota bacterium]
MTEKIDLPEVGRRIEGLLASVEKVIRGKRSSLELAVITLLARGHLLIEDVPGVGKTTLAYALARSLDCTFHRIQFTSDLLPSDLTGISVYNQHTGRFEFRRGPLFANVVLADEINRTTPKTQSALLEAMSEGSVTADDQTHSLPNPFMVIATQNPIDHHGTFPLPESQLDRFLMRIRMGYPGESEEKEILREGISYRSAEELEAVLSIRQILQLQDAVREVAVEESLLDYILQLIRETRRYDLLSLGVSPRGAMALYRSAQARALVHGRDYCVPDDIKMLAVPVLAHRVVVSQKMASPVGETDEAEWIIRDLLEKVPVPG